jgi:hypothetical protein
MIPTSLNVARNPARKIELILDNLPVRVAGGAVTVISRIAKLADTSLAYDRDWKLPLYAGVGIPEAWLVDLNAGAIEAYSEPGPNGYGKVAHFGREGKVVSVTLPGLAFDTVEALPPEG